jgi:hypothetical protein
LSAEPGKSGGGVEKKKAAAGVSRDGEDIPVPTPQRLHQVAVAISHSRTGNSGVYIYEDVRVQSVERAHEDIGYAVTFSLLDKRKIDWQNTQRFMKGSLLCLSPDGTFNESSLVVATVLRGVHPPQSSRAGWVPTVTICIDRDSIDRFDPAVTYLMIESMVFFEAYRPVLDSLQKLGQQGDLPFLQNLLGKSMSLRVRSWTNPVILQIF